MVALCFLFLGAIAIFKWRERIRELRKLESGGGKNKN
jgi:hypothetical protein